jgi:hypothetical protein
MKENRIAEKKQLEMGLPGNQSDRRCRSHHPRRKRAQWWFNQMRLLVDSAPDLQPASPQREG